MCFLGDQINNYFSNQMIKGNKQRPEKDSLQLHSLGSLQVMSSILSRQEVNQAQKDTKAQNLPQAVSRNPQGILSGTFFLILVI